MMNMQVQRRRQIGGYSIRWDAERARAAYAGGWWVRETLADALRSAAERSPNRCLIVDGETRLDATTLHAQAKALAQAILARVPVGSVVSFMLPNWHEAAVIYAAATLAGMVAHPILTSLRDREVSHVLRDVRSRMVFVPALFRGFDYAAMLRRVTAQMEPRPEVVIVRGSADEHRSYADLLASGGDSELPALDPESVRLVLHTSGTTGTSKGILHSHNSMHALLRQIGEHWLVEPGDTFLVPSPISHIGGSIYAFEAPLLLGTTAVLMERWDPQQALELAQVTRCTHICGATPFLEQLLDAARRARERLPSLKLFVCGGASVPPSLIRDAAAHFERAIVTRVYGSTEVPVTTVGCLDRADLAHAAETDGRAGIAEIKLAPLNAASALEGEVLVRGPQMLAGYVHPEDEPAVFDGDGFYRTGDVGRWIDDRYLVISGRLKDIIIRNGENIAPKEIEDLLAEHPQIAEVAIIGVPDRRTGERACAVIVPAGSSAPDLAGLRAFLEQKGVAMFKIPEQIVVRDSLPRNDTGKVLKHHLRAELAGSPPRN